ncbi:hypothetical protein, partial [Pseudomonas sp. I2]|uniref:hypothetical protein n=1 Tax=Pseudomonas sp. I2 TaxID=1338438 RepID=UPI0034D609F3
MKNSYGYPFALISEVIYRLDAASGLHVLIRTQNIGDELARYCGVSICYFFCFVLRFVLFLFYLNVLFLFIGLLIFLSLFMVGEMLVF